jgi:hypothetical protein
VQKWLSSTGRCKARHPPCTLAPRDLPCCSTVLLWLEIREVAQGWKPRGVEGERRSAPVV